jgi:hypothetical protein
MEYYLEGDVVFAKCNNTEPWPALIKKVKEDNIYLVQFYNYKSSANIKI